jgi:hypothetical protein
VLSNSNTCIDEDPKFKHLHRGHLHAWQTLLWTPARQVFKNKLVLGFHWTFVWKAVGCARWMESAWLFFQLNTLPPGSRFHDT